MSDNRINVNANNTAHTDGSAANTYDTHAHSNHNAASAKDHRYEALYTELLDRGDQLHEGNKRRIRRGLIFLIILPVVLDFIRLVTNSDKVVFLIIWIFIMFVASAFLIGVEYLDSAVEKTLQDVTDTESNFDGLLPKPELQVGDLHERIRERIDELRVDRLEGEESQVDEEAEYIEEVIEHLEQTMDEVTAIAADAIALNRMDEIETGAAPVPHESESKSAAASELSNTEIKAQAIADINAAENAAITDLQEAEEAMEELRETAPAEIIAAMKEAFDAGRSGKEDE